MRVAIGSDHAGFAMKGEIVRHVEALGHAVEDVGTRGPEPVDYPVFAEAVGRAVLDGRAERGIILCGSGVGASVAANKVRGVRAAICHDAYSAHQGVEHDDMNVLCLGSEIVGGELAQELVRTFLRARFIGGGRYADRLEKVAEMERMADG